MCKLLTIILLAAAAAIVIKHSTCKHKCQRAFFIVVDEKQKLVAVCDVMNMDAECQRYPQDLDKYIFDVRN